MIRYKVGNEIYTVTKCELKDIPSHLGKVLSYLSDNEVNTQIERMTKAVELGNAIKVIDSNETNLSCFYYEVIAPEKLLGITLYHTTYKDWVILADAIFYEKPYITTLYVMPHKDNISFKSLIDIDSAKGFQYNGTPLKIFRFSDKWKKFMKLYKRAKIERMD